MSGRDLIIGAKGGDDKQHTPVESPDSLRSIQYARILDAVCEGEIEGFADPANPLRCVYLDDTPIQNSDGSNNFSGVTLFSRPGSASQAPIPGFQGAESEFAVGQEIKSSSPVVRTLSSNELTAVRVTVAFPQLVAVNANSGDSYGTVVNMAIDVQTGGGGYVQRLAFQVNGKCTTTYQRAYRIELTGAGPWDVRVRKVTPDSASVLLSNTAQWASYTEIIDVKLRYPHTALMALEVDASHFRNIPQRGYDLKLLRVQVPVNYDPVSREYTGVWDGSFKVAWTDNPAWCFYDLATNPRYGLGEFITAAQIDKWTLYSIAQYCDQLVDDGFGTEEPRFTCNLYLQTQAEAYTVLNNLASVFRGLLYWIAGTVSVVIDAPADPIYQFNQTTVSGGLFRYSGSSRRARHTVAFVSWNDPANRYQQKLEYVPDEAGIARYGVVPIEFTSFGCTSRGQAHRAGSWLLASERLEKETVTFQIGLEGVQIFPGAIVQVLDPARAQIRMGGRVASATVDQVVLDAQPGALPPAGAEICCTLPDGSLEWRPIASLLSDTYAIVPPFSIAPRPGATWIIRSSELTPTLWRIVSIAEAGPHLYDITALSHDENKFAAIEQGIVLEGPPTVYVPVETSLPAPTGLAWREITVTTPIGIERRLELSWVQPAIALGHVRDYVVEWSFENGQRYRAEHVVDTLYQIPSSPGSYAASVWAIGPTGATSQPATSTYTVQDTSPIAGFRVTGLELYGQGNDTVFLDVDAAFAWRYNTPATASDLGSEPRGADSGFMPATFKDFEVRVYALPSLLLRRVEHTTDPHWTYTLAENTEDHGGAPARAFRIGVAVRDTFNNVSEQALLDVSNPAPDPPTAITVFSGQQLLNVRYTQEGSPDYRGVVVYGSTSSGFTPSGANTLYRGSDATATLPGLIPAVQYFLRLASFDAFGTGTTDPVEYTGSPAPDAGDIQSMIAAFNEVLSGADDEDKLIFESNAFGIRDPNNADHFPFGIVQMPDLSWLTVLRSDVIIDGNLSVANLTSGNLPTDVVMTLGGGTVIIDGAGSIQVYRALGANQDFVDLTAGDVAFKKYIPGTGYVEYKSLRRLETGTADSGTTVLIPGYWESQPKVQVSPAVIPLYDAGNAGQDQTIRCQALNVAETAPGSMQWQFEARATLELAANTGQTQINVSSGDTSAVNYTSAIYTTQANTSAITLHIQTRSKRGTGASGVWNIRRYRYRVDYKLVSSGTWTTGTLTAWTTLPSSIDTYVSSERAVSFGSADTWNFRLFIEWDDTGGTFGAPSYTFSNENLTGTGLGQVCRSTASYPNFDSDTGSLGGLPASTLNPTWEIYQIVYTFQYDLQQDSNRANPSLFYYGNMTESISCRGTLKNSNSYVDQSASSIPQKNNVAGSHTYNGSSHVTNPITGATSCNITTGGAGGFVSATVNLDSLSAIVRRRTPVANSGTAVNTAVVQFYDYTLASAAAIASGSLNWLAIGT